jgi:hypothetical protein
MEETAKAIRPPAPEVQQRQEERGEERYALNSIVSWCSLRRK